MGNSGERDRMDANRTRSPPMGQISQVNRTEGVLNDWLMEDRRFAGFF
jgi:hypothetical protein